MSVLVLRARTLLSRSTGGVTVRPFTPSFGCWQKTRNRSSRLDAVVPPGVTLSPGAKYWVAVEVISSGPNSYLWYGGPITEYYYLSQPYGSFPPTATGLGLGYGPNAYLRMTYSPNISTTPAKMSTIGGASYLAQHDNYIFWYPITAPTFP